MVDKDKQIKEDDVLDCVGLYCPVPIFETRKKIDSMDSGKVLKMVADDPGSEEDIKSWSKSTGNKLLKFLKEDENYIFYIKKS